MILLKFLYIALKTYITHLLYSFFTWEKFPGAFLPKDHLKEFFHHFAHVNVVTFLPKSFWANAFLIYLPFPN